MGVLADQLAALDRDVDAAGDRWRAAQREADREREATAAVLAEVVSYDRDVFFRRGEADPAEAQRITAEACARIVADGLVLVPLGDVPASGVRVFNPAVESDLADATAALNDVQAKRSAFARDHAVALDAERDREAMGRVRDALAGDDPAALREALAS
jgi:hypothetical protein